MISLVFLALAFLASLIYFWRQFRRNNKHRQPAFKSNRRRPQEPLSKEVIADQLKNDDDNVTEIISQRPDPLMNSSYVEAPLVVEKPVTQQAADHIVAVYLLSKNDETFSGYELLQALLSAGLRYGDQKIFHRHEHKDGRGRVLFHCASASAPGTFDLTKMGSFSGKGICLFFSSSEVDEPLMALDCLMETLDQLVDDLGGEVLDEKRATFTQEKLYAHHKQLRALENNKRTADMFQ